MKKLIKQKRGQFVIIAMLMIAIMIISIGALMHRAVTYYKHEPWEEYLTLIGNIELNSHRLVELSLANYTNSEAPNPNILKENLERWQRNLTRIYLGYGISLNYTSYSLVCDWNKTTSFSAANVAFTLDINSIGLSGYKFTAAAFLNLMNTSKPLYDATKSIWTINVTVTGEDKNPITGLKKDNFLPSGFTHTKFTVVVQYDQNYVITYTIKCEGVPSAPSEPIIKVWDSRGIQVTAKYP